MAVQKKGQTMEEAGKGRKTIPDTLAELFAGITASALLFQGVIVWLVKDRLSYSIGLWIGAALAAGLAWHMWDDRLPDKDGKLRNRLLAAESGPMSVF